jgi:hypothetical protein
LKLRFDGAHAIGGAKTHRNLKQSFKKIGSQAELGSQKIEVQILIVA